MLEPLRPASLFYYFRADNVLVDGVDPVGAGVLLAVAVIAGGLALAAFRRRDIGVVLGGSLWERLLRLAPAT